MKRQPPRPDTRLDWRDPEMPVLRKYKFANGEVKTQIDPEYERRYHEMLLATSDHVGWRDDPTYFTKRKK